MAELKMKKISLIICFALFLLALIIGCSPKESRENPLANEATGQIIKETKPTSPLGNISYEKVKTDTAINAIIDSSQKLDNGNLVVKFHHNSNKEEPVSIIGNVRYELSKATTKPNEIITLTVFGWNDEYFELKVGSTSDIFSFGKIPPDREIEIERPNYQTIKYQVGGPQDGKFAVLSGGGVINYKDGNEFKPINLTLIDKGGYWQATEASYHPKIPKYADDWFEFRNVLEGNDHTVKMMPVAGHVEGILSGTDEMKDRVVVYPNAFGNGIDLEVYAYNTHLLKQVVIREPQAKELNFDFELEKPLGKAFQLHDNEKNEKQDIQFADSMKIKGKEILFGEENPTIMFTPQVWDNSSLREDVEITLYKDKGKTFLRKTIPALFLQNATYPVYTDDDTGLKFPTGYTGDVHITNPTNAYADDDSVANFDSSASWNSEIYYTTFGFGIPAGATINGIELIEAGKRYDVNAIDAGLFFRLYGSGKNSYFKFFDHSGDATITVKPTLGSPTDLWTPWTGGSPTGADFSDANFQLKAYVNTGTADADTDLDYVQLKVYYTPPDTTAPIINGTLNKSISSINQNDVINATFNMTDGSGSINGTIVINNTGIKRYFNFSFIDYAAGTTQQMSQNFTISEVVDTVINITGIAIDNASNRKQNETIFTVSGFKSPTTTGASVWTNPTNAYSSDNTYATVVPNMASEKDQNYGTFGFGVPAGATINGIEVTLEDKVSATGISLYKVSIAGAGHSGSKTATQSTTEAVRTYGSSSDLWGQIWVATDFSDATFNLQMQARDTNELGATISLDHIQVRVYYTPVTDTCTYSSGNWNIAASDNCAITAATSLGGNSLICTGTGTISIGTNGKISNFGKAIIHGGCNLICRNTAGCFG